MSVRIRPYKGQKDRWEVDIRFEWPDGTKHRERKVSPFRSKSQTTRWAEAKERELYKRGPQRKEQNTAVPTLDAFAPRFIDEHLLAERKKPSTVSSYRSSLRNHLIPLMGQKRLDKIDATDVQRVKTKLKGRNEKTVNNTLTVLSMLLKKAVEWGVIAQMPCRINFLKVFHKEREFYLVEDFDHLVETAHKMDARTELIFLLAGEAGLRLGEFLALRWVNVNFQRNVIVIKESDWRRQVTTPKGGRSREVPMTVRLQKALKAHRHLKGERVLTRPTGEPLTERQVRRMISKVERRAGREETGRVHVLRHTFCSHLAMAGAPAKAIQELAGHADLTMTMRYMHLSPGARSQAIDLLNTRTKGTPIGPEKAALGAGRGWPK